MHGRLDQSVCSHCHMPMTRSNAFELSHMHLANRDYNCVAIVKSFTCGG